MTDRTFNLSRDDITHKGWLKKQGGPFKTWQRRYFILQGEYLHYFLREDEPRPLGTIPLRNNRVEKRPVNPDDPGKFLFEILPGVDGPAKLTSSHETFLLWGCSVQDVDEWVQSVRRAIYKQKGGGIFGQSLLDTITNESTTSTKQIPSIVEQCVEQLRERGLQEEGIFRLPGRVSLIKELQERFDCGEKPDFRAMNTDIHTIASLFKLYLRLLPEPLIPWQHYQSFYDGIKLHQEREEEGKKELIQQLALLPRTNYNLLKYLCEFLHDVQSYESYNRMGMLNLATVFGPNIFRPRLENATSLMETTTMSQKFLHLLIREHDEMFPPNDQIFQTMIKTKGKDKPLPTPPPRKMGRNATSSPESVDLLKELQDKVQTPPVRPPREKKDGVNHESLLLDLESDWIKVSASLAFTKRSYSVDGAFGFQDDTSQSDSSTLESSSEHLSGHSEVNSQNTSRVDLDATITPASPTLSPMSNLDTLTSFDQPLPPPLLPSSNQPHTSPKRNQPHTSPKRKSASLGVDLTAGTPESAPLHSSDYVSSSPVKLVEEIAALKTEMVKWKIKCEGLEIQLQNEETAKKATEDRNKQLLKQLNAFIAEYGPK
ncbi:rho GTPase-activating protein 24-like isoform X2 [Patiria miniata]|nr:rho GTPase-activating protein 24-like isoform X2 [Patiria miniata]XP_038061486.1 rho GTPase-activating protein 24-like isoform X2 [Patiria miniata]XP_038061487.1 rho GTPase-activating protein 24-like isoform X2 [Patiria miniata]